MRTLDASLLAALESGKFKPYLQLQYCVGDDFTWTNAPYDLISYKLGGCELDVNTFGDNPDEWFAIRLLRGVVIAGTPVYVTSSHYYVNEAISSQKENLIVRASIFPKGNYHRYFANGNTTFKVVIDAICAYYGYTASYEDPASAFWSNLFLPIVDDTKPSANNLILQSPFTFFSILRQRLLIYAQDNNDGEIYFRQWLDDSLVGTGGHPSLETITTFDWKKQYKYITRLLKWTDETGTDHFYPNPITHTHWPIHNLGIFDSSDTLPTAYQCWHAEEDKRTWHLKYQDGDIIHTSAGTYQVMAFEVFDKKHSPELYLQFVALPKFLNTEAGMLSEDQINAGSFTPVDSSGFTGQLGSSDNNVQVVINKLSKHNHRSTIASPAPTAPIEGKDMIIDVSLGILYLWDGSQWWSLSGLVPPVPYFSLLENSSYFLIENGSKLILG
jgi:hypothetical protein